MVALGSVADIKEGTGGSGDAGESLGTLGSMRTTPLAAEIPVNATGTRPGTGPDKRELFTEETATVLVFPDGAVIQLSAAVATGQLVFLTNKQTNIEVVCQVVGKRVYRPTSCYVELKFTEDIAEFWGVEFPKEAGEPTNVSKEKKGQEAPQTETGKLEAAHQESVKEEVASAPAIEESGADVEAMPTDKEVEELREKVEALRRQLDELRRAETSAKTVTAMAGSAEAAPVAALGKVASEDQATRVQEVEPVVARSSHVAMKLPNQAPAKIDPELAVIDQLLPQPALDFSKAPILERDPNDPYSIYKPTRAKVEKWLLVLLVMGLVAAVGVGALSLGLLNRFKAAREKTEQAREVAAAKVPESAKSAAKPKAGGDVAGTGAATTKDAPATEVAKIEESGAATGNTKTDGGASDAAHVEKSVDKPIDQSMEKKGVGRVEAAKRGVGAGKKHAAADSGSAAAATPASNDAAPAVEEGPVVPAKLLKSVNPVYPPDAMRNFITGDVRLKAEVDEKGKLRSLQVVSGPVALREAAIEAFKQYEYTPATRNGKGVTSEVKVTIKFWFNP